MEKIKKESLKAKIDNLVSFFDNNYDYPAVIKIDNYQRITDVPKFIGSHVATIMSHGDKPAYDPYLERLLRLKNYVTNNNIPIIGVRIKDEPVDIKKITSPRLLRPPIIDLTRNTQAFQEKPKKEKTKKSDKDNNLKLF